MGDQERPIGDEPQWVPIEGGPSVYARPSEVEWVARSNAAHFEAKRVVITGDDYRAGVGALTDEVTLDRDRAVRALDAATASRDLDGVALAAARLGALRARADAINAVVVAAHAAAERRVNAEDLGYRSRLTYEAD